MAEAAHPPVTVYVSARVYDRSRDIRSKRGRRKSGGMRHCWSLRLERWTPEEVELIIRETFTRLAAEEAAAIKETANGI